MALLTAAAVAVATWFAAAASGGAAVGGLVIPMALLAPALGAGVAVAGVRRSAPVLPPGKDVVVLTAVSVAGFLALYLAGWTTGEHLGDAARLLPLVVVGLGVLWPEPNVLRYCLLLAGGTLLGTVGQPAVPRWAVGGALVGLAVALVAGNRLTAASGPRLGDARPTGPGRIAREAGAVLVVVALLAALAAALVPPPPGAGGAGGTPREPRAGPAGPPVVFEDRLDLMPARGERSDHVVLRVFSSEPDLWRATTYDHWDGGSWERSSGGLVDVSVDGGFVTPGVGDVPEVGGSEPPTLSQSVLVQASYAAVLVAAPRPYHVALGTGGGALQAPDGSLYPASPLTRGQRYAVTSVRSEATAAGLRALGHVPAAAIPRDVADRYLQLPHLPAAVRARAADLAGGAPTAYDMVRAVERWLRDNTTATDDAAAVPAGIDPLEHFLTERSGPPERAATSMAVMLRALGVPSRIAVGFLPGRRAGPGREFVVRASDSHAWVEAWFPEAGWQRFDPTGRAPDRGAESVWDRLWRFLKRLWPLVAAVALLATAWLASRGVRWWRRRSARPWATRFFARLERAGAARGRPRRPQETPAEYARGLARTVLPDPRLDEIGDLVTVAAYSRHEPPAEARARAEEVLRAAAKASPVRRLRRFTRSGPAPRPTIPMS